MPTHSHSRSRTGSESPTEQPAYFLAEAACFLSLPRRTIRDWSIGRTYPAGGEHKKWEPLLIPADPKRRLLSFSNLVELHVIASIRRGYGVVPKKLRKAIQYLERTSHSPHPLLDHDLLTDRKELFIERYGELVSISEDGQMCLKAVLEAYVRRIEWDASHIPIRLYPFTTDDVDESRRLVVIDPHIRSGRPCIAGTGIPTSIVGERFKAGEDFETLAKDYGRPTEEIQEAIRYESRVAS
jgi:uncharacterized protein (DUF433 family)